MADEDIYRHWVASLLGRQLKKLQARGAAWLLTPPHPILAGRKAGFT